MKRAPTTANHRIRLSAYSSVAKVCLAMMHVPYAIRRRWLTEGMLRKRDVRRNWNKITAPRENQRALVNVGHHFPPVLGDQRWPFCGNCRRAIPAASPSAWRSAQIRMTDAGQTAT